MPRILILYIACAVFTISSRLMWPDIWAIFAVLKPLTTILVIVWAYQRAGSPFTTKKLSSPNISSATSTRDWAILVGLVLSLIGDIALLWPEKGFLGGLIAFLLAHIAFLVAFTREVRLGAWPLAHIAYAALGGAILAVLWPGISNSLRLPVVLYIVCLVTMASQAASWWRKAPANSERSKWAAFGGLLFVASDCCLAFDKFYAPLPLRSLWVQTTYWAALGMIVYSISSKSTTFIDNRN